ncbi:MAG: LPXTG cell wall anchor domain-containing protein [Clostridia bacterium]|nr:LPXTG cell wall anchor domain-containing protein [Clostridia bacterium]
MNRKTLFSIPFPQQRYANRLVAVFLLSIVIVTAVFWRLKLTGITLAGEAFCGMDEHTHTEECLAAGCKKQEHTHVELCYTDPEAGVETAVEWEASLGEYEDTVFYTSDLLAVAESQLGYTESERNFTISQTGARCGYTRYGAWYGNPYGEWSAMFVSFCLEYAGIPDTFAPYGAGAETMRTEWDQSGLLFGREEYLPIPGDLIFFDTDADGKAETVGILYSHSGTRITVIQGDVEGAVAAVTYLPNDGRILSYGSMNEVIRASATEDELVHLDFTVEYLDTLPTYEEVDETLTSLEEDMDAYEAYFLEVGKQAQTAYTHLEGLGRLQPLVSNAYKSQDLEWIWQSESFQAQHDIVYLPVYAVNPKNQPVYMGEGYGTIVYGGSPADVYTSFFPGTENYNHRNHITCGYFQWWKAYVIEAEPGVGYYVSKIHYYYGDGQTKEQVKASSSTGFVYFMFCDDDLFTKTPETEKIPIGTFIDVTVPEGSDSLFTITGTDTYPSINFSTTASAPVTPVQIGTLKTGDAPELKEPVNNTDLTTVDTVDTSKYITINLFDYDGKKINKPFLENNYYPAFKLGSNSDPTTWTGLDTFGYDMGNLLAYDVIRQEGYAVDGTINQVRNDVSSLQGNVPLVGMMHPVLYNGYPAVKNNPDLSDPVLSLEYLFHADSGYTRKQNKDGLSYLLQYDEETGAYYYDSRKNFAHYDAEKNRFVVYDQILTPGFLVYPFGNFFPLHDIQTEATPVTKIGKKWFQDIAHSAWYKYVHAMNEGGLVDASEYKTIYLAIVKLISFMDKEYPDGWNYSNLMQEYFTRAGLELPPPPEGEEVSPHLTKLYTLDFDEPTNFHFGMDMHMEFMMPKDGMTGKDGKSEMVYKFSGDDDVWVYIDDVLFLDLSGTHRHVGGEINFAKGEVYYYYLDTAKGDVYTYEELIAAVAANDTTKGRIVTFAEILENAGKSTDVLNAKGTFENYTEHQFDFYYMERGAGSGVCSMYFNMPLLQTNRIEVVKEMNEEAANALGNPEFLFQILKVDGAGNKTEEPLYAPGTSYQVLDVYGNVIATRTVGENGVFYLHANERADFAIPENGGSYYVRELLDEKVFEQYGKVTVDGVSYTTDTYTNVELSSDTFKGVEGPVMNASSGNAKFIFVNHVDPHKYGTFEISKTANEYSDTVAPGTFTFSVMFGDLPLPVGTPYTLIDANGNETVETVKAAGILTLQAGQRAVFNKVLAGTSVLVKELDAEKYFVEYTAEYPAGTDYLPTEDENGYVTIPVGASVTSSLSVYNDRKGTKLEVTGGKEVLYEDGTAGTYTFVLEEVDENGNLLADGIYLEQTITVTENGSFTFTLNYPEETTPGTYYYRVYEKGADATAGGDETLFPFTVAVEKDENGVLTATAHGADAIKFVNRDVRSLTVSKTVEGLADPDGYTFSFTVSASVGGVQLNGEYHTDKGILVFADGVATFTLKHGESLTILDLPYGTAWTVTEGHAPGFYTENAVGEGDRAIGSSASGELKENASVAYYNIGGAELPATGGFARDLFPLVGSVLMLGSTAGAVIYRKKRKE